MFTDRSPLLTLAVVVAMLMPVGLAHAQVVEQPASWREHEQIDAQMGTLQGPVWQPVWFTREDGPERPAISPIYKQQPPGAQQDFRPQPTPPVTAPATTQPNPPVTTQPTSSVTTQPAPEPELEPDPEPEPITPGCGLVFTHVCQ